MRGNTPEARHVPNINRSFLAVHVRGGGGWPECLPAIIAMKFAELDGKGREDLQSIRIEKKLSQLLPQIVKALV